MSEAGLVYRCVNKGREFAATLYTAIAAYRVRWQLKRIDKCPRGMCNAHDQLTHDFLTLLLGCHLTLYAAITAYKVAANPLS